MRKPALSASQGLPNVRTKPPRRAQTGRYSRVQIAGPGPGPGPGPTSAQRPLTKARKPAASASQAFGKVCCLRPRTAQTGDQRLAVLQAGLRGSRHPERVLVGTRLHRQMVVEAAQMG